MGSIITLRIIFILMANITAMVGSYYTTMPCDKLAFIFGNSRPGTLKSYPDCISYFNGTNPSQHSVVRADFLSETGAEIVANLDISFGTATWLALALHAIGVEIYVSQI